MKRLFSSILLMATIMTTASVAAQNSETIHINMWSNSDAPHSNNLKGAEVEAKPNRISNITRAELEIFPANPRTATGQAVVICPGGGYGLVSIDIEGTMVAEYLAANGITAAVLKYRMPNGVKEVPYEDVLSAMRVMRQRSRQLGYQPDKIGLCGASAGGHLAASVATLAPKGEKPAFTILFYPVISGVKGIAHEGSFNHLLGKDRTVAETLAMSLERHVDENTPPAIMFHSANDTAVPVKNSILYFEQLRMYDKTSALYIFPEGGHGWSMSERVDGNLWQPLLLNWLNIVNRQGEKKATKQTQQKQKTEPKQPMQQQKPVRQQPLQKVKR